MKECGLSSHISELIVRCWLPESKRRFGGASGQPTPEDLVDAVMASIAIGGAFASVATALPRPRQSSGADSDRGGRGIRAIRGRMGSNDSSGSAQRSRLVSPLQSPTATLSYGSSPGVSSADNSGGEGSGGQLESPEVSLGSNDSDGGGWLFAAPPAKRTSR
jgi:hypothetical protein